MNTHKATSASQASFLPLQATSLGQVKMVKFSKQFEGQLVPEWKDAFVDYWQLKKDLKRIHILNNHNTPPHKNRTSPTNLLSSIRKFSLFGHHSRDHVAIQVKILSFISFPHSQEHVVDGYYCWQVHKKLASSASKGDLYETELLEQFADTDAAKEFFNCLDAQLNKVNQFYKTKEKEFLERGESLKKQMEILIELRAALKRRKGAALDSKEDPSISCTISCGTKALFF